VWRFYRRLRSCGRTGGVITLVTEVFSEIARLRHTIVSHVRVFGSVIGGLGRAKVDWRTAYLSVRLGLVFWFLALGVAGIRGFSANNTVLSVPGSRVALFMLFTNAHPLHEISPVHPHRSAAVVHCGPPGDFFAGDFQGADIQVHQVAQGIAFTYLASPLAIRRGYFSHSRSRAKILFAFLALRRGDGGYFLGAGNPTVPFISSFCPRFRRGTGRCL